jgi:hypothetical protein
MIASSLRIFAASHVFPKLGAAAPSRPGRRQCPPPFVLKGWFLQHDRILGYIQRIKYTLNIEIIIFISMA